MDPTKQSLKLLRYLPRFNEKNLLIKPFNQKLKPVRGPRRIRWPVKSNEERQRWHPIGFEQGRTPWYLRVPEQKYYQNFDARRQYPPFSLAQLQLMVDTKTIDPNKPVDLSTLCISNHFDLQITDNHYGVHLTSDGLDRFCACLNIEVQYAREPVIAAIERNGGKITTAYFDIKSVSALADPHKFFNTGEPIPKRQLPPPNAIDYYTDPKNRGYLADPEAIEEERFKLSQKYGYELPTIEDSAKREMLMIKKHINQVFYGLYAGYVVNLKDREILEPLDEELREFYGLPSLEGEKDKESATN